MNLQTLKANYESYLKHINKLLECNLTQEAFTTYKATKAEYEAVLRLINEKLTMETL